MTNKIRLFVLLSLIVMLFSGVQRVYAGTSESAVRHISINGIDMDYEGTNGLVYYNDRKINNAACRSVILKNAAYLWAKRVFEKTLKCTYIYDELTGYISITKGDITIEMYIDSHECYINDKFVYCEYTPKVLYSYANKKSYVIVPGRFVCEHLGYKYDWDSTKGASMITKTDEVGAAPLPHPNLVSMIMPEEGYGNGLDDPASYKYTKRSYFTWEAVPESAVASSKALIGVKAYADKTGEYIRFSGTGELSPYITKKKDCFIITFQNTANAIGANYAESPVWNLLYSFDLYDTAADVSLCIKADEYADLGYRILYQNDEHTEVLIQFVQRESSPYRQQIDIPIPKDVDFDDVEILDRYSDRLITLRFSGDYRAFYEGLSIPYESRSIRQIRTYYDSELNRTSINLYSDLVCAFKTYELDYGHKICVLVDRPENMYDRIIILDAGHGGEDPGTVHEGYQEKDINFNVVYKYAKRLFDASGVYVYYSRYDDTKPELYDRAAYAGDIGADMFISVHQNSLYDKSAHGTEVYYSKLNTSTGPKELTSSDMAYRFLSNLTEALKTENRDVRTQNFVVIRDSECPAVLLECGYMSNHDELMRLKTASVQKKIAKVIFNTVKEIFEVYKTDRFEIKDRIISE